MYDGVCVCVCRHVKQWNGVKGIKLMLKTKDVKNRKFFLNFNQKKKIENYLQVNNNK